MCSWDCKGTPWASLKWKRTHWNEKYMETTVKRVESMISCSHIKMWFNICIINMLWKKPLVFRKHWTETVLWAEDASRGNLNERNYLSNYFNSSLCMEILSVNKEAEI